MEECTKLVLTASVTIIGGVIVFVMGQIVSKFFIDPIQDLKKLLGEIRYCAWVVWSCLESCMPGEFRCPRR